MNRDDEHTRLLGELHRALSASVPKQDYMRLVGCMKACRDVLEETIVTLEQGKGKRETYRVAKDARIYLAVLESHLDDRYVTRND